eukprot:1475948-Amphidinium_carterae.2
MMIREAAGESIVGTCSVQWGLHVLEEITLENLDNSPTKLRLGVDLGAVASVMPHNMSTSQVLKDKLAGRVFMTATSEKVTDEGY